MVASLAFVGYAVVSVFFALVAGARLDAEQNLTLSVQGVFIVPFLINAGIAIAAGSGLSRRGRVVAGVSSFVLSAIAIMVYQWVVGGVANLSYALIAPVLPAIVVWLLLPRAQGVKPPLAPVPMDDSGGATG